MQHAADPDDDAMHITARRGAGVLRSVAVSRPAPIDTTALAGLDAVQASNRMASLGTASPHAFACAIGLAAASALGEAPPDHAAQVALERELAAEAANEHLARLLIDWPRLVGLDVRRNRYGEFRRRLLQCTEPEARFALGGDILDLLARELLGGFFNRFRLPHGLADFVERADAGGSLGSVLVELIGIGAAQAPEGGTVPLLESRSAAQWAAVSSWPEAGFAAAPTLAGAPAETGPLARHADSPLVNLLLNRGHRISGRLFAKVIELAECASRMRHPLIDELPALAEAAPTGPGAGLARVETAQGVLLCWLRMADGRLAECVVVTPDDWNFHPNGAFAHEATGWEAGEREAALMRLSALALAIDPAVPYRIELVDEDGEPPAPK